MMACVGGRSATAMPQPTVIGPDRTESVTVHCPSRAPGAASSPAGGAAGRPGWGVARAAQLHGAVSGPRRAASCAARPRRVALTDAAAADQCREGGRAGGRPHSAPPPPAASGPRRGPSLNFTAAHPVQEFNLRLSSVYYRLQLTWQGMCSGKADC